MGAVLADISVSPQGVDLVASQPAGHSSAFLILLGFFVSFAFIRTSTRLIRMEVKWWPGNVETASGLHIHHLFWGIILMILAGFVGALELSSPWWQITAAAFGVGVGLTLDEYALWLHLDDVYWSDTGRSSIDAVVIAFLVFTLIVIGARPFDVDQGGDIAGTVIYTLVDVCLALITLAKKRLFLGVLAFFIPFIGLWCACRVGKPNSFWATRFYTDKNERGRRKMAKSLKRFPPDRWTKRLGRRLQDMIGGTPTPELGSARSRPSHRRADALATMEIVLAIVAAILFALGTVLQQKAGLDEPVEVEGSGLLLQMARRPVWLAGIAADALGFVAQAIALTIGRLAVVQPLLVMSVVFALPLGVRLTRQKVRRRDIVAAVLVACALAVFLIVADPSGGRNNAPFGQWLIAGAACFRDQRGAVCRVARRAAGIEGDAAGDLRGRAVRAVGGADQGCRRPVRKRRVHDLRPWAPVRADRRRLCLDDAQPDGAQHRRAGPSGRHQHGV